MLAAAESRQKEEDRVPALRQRWNFYHQLIKVPTRSKCVNIVQRPLNKVKPHPKTQTLTPKYGNAEFLLTKVDLGSSGSFVLLFFNLLSSSTEAA